MQGGYIVVNPTARVGAGVAGGVAGFAQVGLLYTAMGQTNGFGLPVPVKFYVIPALEYAAAIISAGLGIAGALGKGPLKAHPLAQDAAIGFGAATAFAQYLAKY